MTDNRDTNTKKSDKPKSLAAVTRGARLDRKTDISAKLKTYQTREENLTLQTAEYKLKLKVGIGQMALDIGLGNVVLSSEELTGGLLAILEAAKDAEQLAGLERRGKEWIAAQRRHYEPGHRRCFITAPRFSTDLADACREMGMRKVSIPKGFSGVAALEQAVKVAEKFSANLLVVHGGEEMQLATNGVVDKGLLAAIQAQPGGTGSEEEGALSDAGALSTDDAVQAGPGKDRFGSLTGDGDLAPAAISNADAAYTEPAPASAPAPMPVKLRHSLAGLANSGRLPAPPGAKSD
jgi:hypothetical protein